MWHKSTGIIKYDPPRPGMKKRTKWWCVVNVDKEITRYYRWWIQRELHIKGLCQPSWDAHISIIRGEEPIDELKHLWKKYDGQKVEFEYKHYPRRSGDRNFDLREDRPDFFWFVEVRCPLRTEIRGELGRPTGWKHHITVGRTWF